MQLRQRVFIFDVDSEFLTNLKQILENARLVAEHECDLFILRSNLQHEQTERLLSEIHRSCPNCRCMVLDSLEESSSLLKQMRSGVDVTNCANCGVDLTTRRGKQCEFCHKIHCLKCADCHTPDCDEQLGPIARMLGY